MSTVLFTHPACLDHDTGEYHPECADRLRVILRALEGEEFMMLLREIAPMASIEQLERVHSPGHVAHVQDLLAAARGEVSFDPDTVAVQGSWEAALRSAGAAVAAVDAVARGECRNAFCAVRPPGHHAGPDKAMGFCLFNNVAIGARHAQAAHGLERVAAIDFDVHHGNGVQDIFENRPGLFYVSIHQDDAYPGTGLASETGAFGNILNLPLPAGTGSEAWRAAMRERALPALAAFKPDLLMISAGFDAHRADPMADFRLTTQDFHWASLALADLARDVCDHRLVSVLEGGYDLPALAASVAAHLRGLMGF